MKKVIGNTLVEGILLLILGVVLLLKPNEALEFIFRIIGVILLIMAAMRIVPYLQKKPDATKSTMSVGIVQLIVGLLLLIVPKLFTLIMPIAFALLIGFGAVTALVRIVKSRNEGNPVSVPPLILAIVTLVLAVVILFRPGFGTGVFMRIVGIALMVEGISLILAPPSSAKAIESK